MKKEDYSQECIDTLKIKMVGWIIDLSICFSEKAEPLIDEQIAKMVEMIMRLIIANKMTLDPQPYSSAIRLIASGNTDTYRLNIIRLMKVFRDECRRYEESKKIEKW